MPRLDPLFYDSYRAYRIPKDMWGNTYFHDAIQNQDATELGNTISSSLLAIDVKDLWSSSRSTPVLLACKRGNSILAKMLITSGANINLPDHAGYTPLHYACMYRMNELTRVLIEHGAKLTKNTHGAMPIDYYFADIRMKELDYPYGFDQSGELQRIYDHDHIFSGTRCPDYSALRWFVHEVVANYEDINVTKKIPTTLWNKDTYMKYLNKFILTRDSQFSADIAQTLIYVQARFLYNEYVKRENQLVLGWISKKHFKEKKDIVYKILKNQLITSEIIDTDGRTKKLVNYRLKLNKKKEDFLLEEEARPENT